MPPAKKPAEPLKKTAWHQLVEERMAFGERTAERLKRRAAAARRA